jgi:AcrR family transcriptional regulator
MSLLREKILTTASHLFQTQGINSTGVDAIVAAAGTTKMTLYKHFRSKENLILEVLEEGHKDFQASQPSEKLQKLFDFIEEWVTSPNFRGMGFIKASAEFPSEASPVHQLSSEQSRQFKQYISSLAHEANIQDADGLALQLSLLFEGAVQAEQMIRGSGAMTYAKKAAKILINGASIH